MIVAMSVADDDADAVPQSTLGVLLDRAPSTVNSSIQDN